jgi:hypothetical protein
MAVTVSRSRLKLVLGKPYTPESFAALGNRSDLLKLAGDKPYTPEN